MTSPRLFSAISFGIFWNRALSGIETDLEKHVTNGLSGWDIEGIRTCHEDQQEAVPSCPFITPKKFESASRIRERYP